MNLFLQSTLILIQWVSGICIFMLFYIFLFKKYQSPKCHIFTIYYFIIGFSLVYDIVITIFPELTPVVRFILFFIKDPLSIVVLAFFISYIVFEKPPSIRHLVIIAVLLIVNIIPHLPYHGAQVYSSDYPMYKIAIIGNFVFIVLSLVKTIRDYGESAEYEVPKGLWWFLGMSFVHKTSNLIFASLGFLSFEFNFYSAISMIMMIAVFFLLLNVFYETIILIKNENYRAAISKNELLAKEESDVIHFIATQNPELLNKFSQFELSDRELALIYFTIMGISLKESADYFNVSSKTIEQYRYRLKKKMGLKSSLSQSVVDMKFETF
ncbi:MAG: LuxR C-terminal-related transcriptional regulator [Cyclobacteriaceae bacterium]